MNDTRLQILLVEDDELFLHKYQKDLAAETADYDITTARSLKEARAAVAQRKYAVVLTDIKLKAASKGGLELLKEVKASHADTQVIVFTGIGGTDDARQAEESEADGYLTKPLEPERLRQVTRNAVAIYVERQRIREEMSSQQIPFPTPERFIYYCRAMTDRVNQAALLASSSDNILIVGEAGTGKGLLAEGIHFGSGREGLELINCRSLSDRTLERILFGTYNESAKVYVPGVLERLQHGTLILDRITGLSLRLQHNLFQALQTKIFQVHPECPEFSVTVRVVAISETDLSLEVAQGFFSADLHSIVAQHIIEVPPLRERKDDDYNDVIPLAAHFVRKHAVEGGISLESDVLFAPETEFILTHYPFPQNVGELETIARLTLTKSMGRQIQPDHLPERMHLFGIRAGLATRESVSNVKVKCPHGPMYCNQTELIINAQRTLRGVYLNADSDLAQGISETILKRGLTPLFPEVPPNAQTGVCIFCAQIQSARWALVDISAADFDISYAIGLLHALGVPTFLCRPRGTQSAKDAFENVYEYTDLADLTFSFDNWLGEVTFGPV